MDDPPDADDSMVTLHAAGWSVGDAAFAGPDGSLVWLVTAHRGGLAIRAEGSDQGGGVAGGRPAGRGVIPPPIQYFLHCDMAADAHLDRGFLVSHVGYFLVAGRASPVVFPTSVPAELTEPRPHAAACSTSTIANRSAISVANSSRYPPRSSST